MGKVNMEELLNCALCPNICRCECPVLQVTGREAVAPAGKARLAVMLQKEQLSWDEEVLAAVSHCLSCRGCTIHCPFAELSLCDELINTRLVAKDSGVKLPQLEPYLANLRNYGSPYGQKNKTAARGEYGADILYFAGCTSLANNPVSIEAACSLFNKAGLSYQMIEEDCCGYPAKIWGDEELARHLAEENLHKIEESGASTLVTGCPECWLSFTGYYQEWGVKLPLEIIDAPTFFLGLIKKRLLKPGQADLKQVSYHDPCIWARTACKTSEPREIINSIPGLELLEANSFGEKTRCCGGGAMFQLSYPDTAAAIAKRRLGEFQSGPPIVTACPFCREGLHQEDCQVLELVELLDRTCQTSTLQKPK
ncbi:MAG: (Fe-S)-binding protein [Bacillota bacterium]